ncbi:helix-turn-helix domain-containing protein [Acinetobacter higginsii]|uniref:helix-turn-helix domain-containing protein n=1 Tax=Acinetobacter higginsii TaxID=70347 RepID=UPI001F4B39F3|nr:helix-turn-helix domain-containing protein [Acinetobacter higginsii]MCH7340315.1 helix-turn-helix domain-containing protein [Acinetobacter higginsii]
MTTQVDKVKEEFAKRLHKGMDMQNYPLRGRARVLSKEFGISDKAASKWLNGEAIPETSKIPLLASFLNISSQWLLSGDTGEENSLNKVEKNTRNEIYSIFIKDLEESFKNGKLSTEIIKSLKENLKLMTK